MLAFSHVCCVGFVKRLLAGVIGCELWVDFGLWLPLGDAGFWGG